MSDTLTPLISKNKAAHQVPTETIAASAIVTILHGGFVFIGGGSATTVTLPDPDSSFDGLVLEFITTTAQAHVITNAAGSGFNGAGAGSDVATFTAAIGNSLRVVSGGGVWRVANNVNATLA